MSPTATIGGTTKDFVDSVFTSGLPPEELLRKLDSWGIDWHLTEQGDLMIRYWQVGAEKLVPQEQVATIRTGRPAPKEAGELEWGSQHLPELRQAHTGQWIAVVDGAVVASAPTLPQLLQAVEQQGVQRPFVTQIPAGQVTWMTTYARPLV